MFTYSHRNTLIKIKPKCVNPVIVKLWYINSILNGVSIQVVAHHSEDSFSSKGGNIFKGICGQILFLIFRSNDMHLLILTCTNYVSMVRYLFPRINHLLVGMQNLTLQIWLFPGNLSDNNVIEKLITGSCSVYFLSTDLEILLTCQTMYWSVVILRIIILDDMYTLEYMIWGVYMYIYFPYFASCTQVLQLQFKWSIIDLIVFNFESMFCLAYEGIFIKGEHYPYGKIKLLGLFEREAFQIFYLNIGQNIVNMIRERHLIFLRWNLTLH